MSIFLLLEVSWTAIPQLFLNHLLYLTMNRKIFQLILSIEKNRRTSLRYMQNLNACVTRIGEELETGHAGAAQDLKDLSEEIRIDFGGADETMETLAAIETLNSVIDAYNQYHELYNR